MTSSHRKFLARAGLVLLTSAAALSVQAQSWPQRPIKAIVPYAAGGFSDQASRIMAEALSYDPVNDFTLISLVGKYSLLMVVNPSVPLLNRTCNANSVAWA